MELDIYVNKRVNYDYDILDTLCAGLVLVGWEVKQIKKRCFDITNAYIKVSLSSGFNAYIKNFRISVPKDLKFATRQAGLRDIKLLLKKKEILHINDFLKRNKSSSVVVKRLFCNESGLIKCQIDFVRGKKKYDKRNLEKLKELKKSIICL